MRRCCSSKRVPASISQATASRASVTSTRAASSSTSPAPAARVSRRCSIGIVVEADSSGKTALGITGIALAERSLGDQRDAQCWRED